MQYNAVYNINVSGNMCVPLTFISAETRFKNSNL